MTSDSWIRLGARHAYAHQGPRLGGGPAHERLMLANLATSLFEHGRITTTEAKAKRLRPLAEKLITFAKRGDLHARRQVMTVIRDKDVVHKLFAEIGPNYRRAPGWLHPDHQGRSRARATTPRWRSSSSSRSSTARVVAEAEQARGTKAAPRKAADRSHQGDRRGRRRRVGRPPPARRRRDRRRRAGRRRRGGGRRRSEEGLAALGLADDDAEDAADAADEVIGGDEPEAGGHETASRRRGRRRARPSK